MNLQRNPHWQLDQKQPKKNPCLRLVDGSFLPGQGLSDFLE